MPQTTSIQSFSLALIDLDLQPLSIQPTEAPIAERNLETSMFPLQPEPILSSMDSSITYSTSESSVYPSLPVTEPLEGRDKNGSTMPKVSVSHILPTSLVSFEGDKIYASIPEFKFSTTLPTPNNSSEIHTADREAGASPTSTILDSSSVSSMEDAKTGASAQQNVSHGEDVNL